MNLGELLQELRENILHDRSHRVSGAEDRLWSDATLVRYIDEAQRRLARQGLVIRDGSTPDVTVVAVEPNVAEYVLHPSIIAVLSARLQDARVDLTRTGHSVLSGYASPDHQAFDTSMLADLPPGRPFAYTTDEQISMTETESFDAPVLRLFPVPSEAATLRLRVVRNPIEQLRTTNLRAIPEVPSDYHLAMLDWAAYLALRIADVDAGMPGRAMEFRATFEATVTEARRLALRRVFAPKSWAFGRNGFTWEK
jgi:hypothetical protein